MKLKSLFFKTEKEDTDNKKTEKNKVKTAHVKDAIPVSWDENKGCFKDMDDNYILMMKTTGTNLFGLKEEDQISYMNAFSDIFNSTVSSGQLYSYEVPADVDQYINDYSIMKSRLDINNEHDSVKYDILDNAQKYLEDTAVTRKLVDRNFIIILKDKDYFQLQKRCNNKIIKQTGNAGSGL